MAVARIVSERGRGRLQNMVAMNAYDIVCFGNRGKYSLATENLNSCHAIIIVSKKAAILAHIAPHSPDNIRSQYPTSALWISHKIDQVVQCFNNNKSNFENQGPGGIVVYGILNKEVALPDQLKLILGTIQSKMQISPQGASYKILEAGAPRGPNKGVVLIEGIAANQLPRVWVEDREILLSQTVSKKTTSTATASSSK